jgi:hypothetical protein
MAQQRQGRCGEVQAIATAATGLACFIFRFLRRPQVKRIRESVKTVFPIHAYTSGQFEEGSSRLFTAQ